MQCRAVIMLLRLLYQISGKYAMRSLRLLESCADGAPVRRAPLRRERPYAGGTPARGAPLRGGHPYVGSAPTRGAPLRGERQRGASAPLDTRDAAHRLYRLRAGKGAAEQKR